MATRDRSVGIGFSNTNVYTLYKKAQAASALAKAQTIATAASQPQSSQAQSLAESVAKEVESAGPRIFRQDELSELKIARFQPKVLGSVIKAEPQIEPAMKQEMKSEIEEKLNSELKGLEDLKSNLNRLQDMHGKLRFMLKELEDLVAKKK